MDAWAGEAKRYVRGCALCGRKGFDPVAIASQSLPAWVKRELQAILTPLKVDQAGHCEDCRDTLVVQSRGNGH